MSVDENGWVDEIMNGPPKGGSRWKIDFPDGGSQSAENAEPSVTIRDALGVESPLILKNFSRLCQFQFQFEFLILSFPLIFSHHGVRLDAVV